MTWFNFKKTSEPKQPKVEHTIHNEVNTSGPDASNQYLNEHPMMSSDKGQNMTTMSLNPSSNSSFLFPSVGSTQSDHSDAKRDLKCDVLASYMHAKQEERLWTSGAPGEGVLIKRRKGDYATSPSTIAEDGAGLYRAVAALNVPYAMTVKTRVIQMTLARAEGETSIKIQSGRHLQVVSDLDALPFCSRNQSAAFVASHQFLVVWEDDPRTLLELAQYIETALVKIIWGSNLIYSGDLKDGEHDEESQYDGQSKPRRLNIYQAIYTSMAILILTAALGSGWRQIVIQQMQESNWLRLLFILVFPGQIWLSLFFFQAIIGNLAAIFGPTSLMQENSRYYSGRAPQRLQKTTDERLPHLTVQMPVYKEGLEAVIKPTIQSIKRAIATYELQGGTANIFVNDDGMQLVSREDAEARQEFYDESSIGWVARPKHNPKPIEGETPFLRRGKFKKASNMNYAMRLSVRVEEILASIVRPGSWTQRDEDQAYSEALQDALEERDGEAWADGNIRIGDYILIIDSDTRVPQDCLLEAVSEMEQSPEVGILQYASGVMNVTDSFFERGITFFTNMIYTMIRFAVANGDVAPFVGHNAILRWSALQSVAYECEDDHWEKYWSESTVSEDFDMALRLQAEGYIVRFAAYKGDGFKEGVSLTVYDELARWEKYAYGCSELIFHPLLKWPTKGPFTKLFRTFVRSNMPLASKVTIMSYIGTYYALGSAWFFTVLNYFLIGFFNGWLDHYYLDSFRVYFAIVFVFSVMGNFSLGVCRHRIGEKALHRSLFENLKWIPMLTIFLGGISLHISQAILSHLFSIDMEWGATSKEVENVSFFQAIKEVGKKFKWMFAFCLTMTAAMLVCAFAIDEDWQIRHVVACWPMGTVVVNHFLLPIALNPQLMTFTW